MDVSPSYPPSEDFIKLRFLICELHDFNKDGCTLNNKNNFLVRRMYIFKKNHFYPRVLKERRRNNVQKEINYKTLLGMRNN